MPESGAEPHTQETRELPLSRDQASPHWLGLGPAASSPQYGGMTLFASSLYTPPRRGAAGGGNTNQHAVPIREPGMPGLYSMERSALRPMSVSIPDEGQECERSGRSDQPVRLYPDPGGEASAAGRLTAL